MKAFAAAWAAGSLNATFKALWSNPASTQYPVLHDQEATPGQPWPYVVMDQLTPRTVERMSGGAGFKRETRDVTMRLNVHAATVSGDDRSAKEIAADLIAEVMSVFGGHPTTAPTATLTLDNGNHLITQYQNDYGVRTGDDEYQWIIDYLFRLDVPVAIA